jgi:hypothetical protein
MCVNLMDWQLQAFGFAPHLPLAVDYLLESPAAEVAVQERLILSKDR